MDRAQVLEPTLKDMVRKEMALMKPLPSIYYPDFIAANQEDRADNVLPGSKACMAHVEQIRTDIRYDIGCATVLYPSILTSL
jgi:myo-inositol-1-phosphate synthase